MNREGAVDDHAELVRFVRETLGCGCPDEIVAQMMQRLGAANGDIIFFGADRAKVVNEAEESAGIGLTFTKPKIDVDRIRDEELEGVDLSSWRVALNGAEPVAAEAELPLPVVSKILKVLTREGLLDSHRGAKGGYSLARSPEQISASIRAACWGS